MDMDKSERSIPDWYRVNLSEPHEVEAWCSGLQCTEAELYDAVETVGAGAAKVTAYFDARRCYVSRGHPLHQPEMARG